LHALWRVLRADIHLHVGLFASRVRTPGYSAGVGGTMEGAGPLVGHSFCWEHRTFEVTDHVEVCAPSPILKEVVKELRDATVKCQRLCNKLEHHLLMLSQQH
jgi:hypothetical protein